MRLRWTIAAFGCAGLLTAYASAIFLCAIAPAPAKQFSAWWALPSLADPQLNDGSPLYSVWLAHRYTDLGSNRITSVWFDTDSRMNPWSGIWSQADPRPHPPDWPPELDPSHHEISSGRMHAAIAMEGGWPLAAVRASAYFDVPYPLTARPAIDVQLRGGLLAGDPVITQPLFPWSHITVLPLDPIPLGLVGNAAVYAIALAAVVQVRNVVRRAMRRRTGRCAACGYVLGASCPDRCSECGADGSASAAVL